jgi:hypothetical protein
MGFFRPIGAYPVRVLTHGLRRGLYFFAASRLRSVNDLANIT